MTSEQIHILIKSCELLKVGIGDYAGLDYVENKNFYPNFRQLVTVNENESYVYLVSNTVYDFFAKVFDYKLESYINSKIDQYKIELDNYLQLNTASKAEADECCKELIKQENKKLTALYPLHLKDANIMQTQKQAWLNSLSYRLLQCIEWTKFIYCKGGKIEATPEILTSFKGDKIFTPLEEEKCFEVALKLKQIEVLKAAISLSKGGALASKFEGGAAALLAIYLKMKLNNPQNVLSFIKNNSLPVLSDYSVKRACEHHRTWEDVKGIKDYAQIDCQKFQHITKFYDQALPFVKKEIAEEMQCDLDAINIKGY